MKSSLIIPPHLLNLREEHKNSLNALPEVEKQGSWRVGILNPGIESRLRAFVNVIHSLPRLQALLTVQVINWADEGSAPSFHRISNENIYEMGWQGRGEVKWGLTNTGYLESQMENNCFISRRITASYVHLIEELFTIVDFLGGGRVSTVSGRGPGRSTMFPWMTPQSQAAQIGLWVIKIKQRELNVERGVLEKSSGS